MASKKSDVELVISARNEAEKTVKDLLKTIRDLNNSSGDLADVQAELKAAFAGVKAAEESLAKTGRDREVSLQKQQTAIDRTKQTLADLTAEYENLKNAAAQARDPSQRLVDTLANQQKRQQELAAAIQQTSSELAQAQARSSSGEVDDRAQKVITDQRKKVIELGQAWRDTTQAIAQAKQTLTQNQSTSEGANAAQAAAKARLDALREELKSARELAALRTKEVKEATEATAEQVAAKNEAVAAVKQLKAAVEAQVLSERKLREERDKTAKTYSDQNKLTEKLVAQAGKQKAAYDKVKAALVGLEKAQADASTGRQQANLDRLSKQLAELQRQYDAVADRVARSQERLNEASGPDPRSITRLDALKAKIQETEQRINEQVDALTKMNSAYDKAGVSSDELAKSQRELKAASEQLAEKQKRLAGELKSTASGGEKAAKAAKAASKEFRVWGEGSRQALSWMQRIRSELLSIAAATTGIYAIGTGIRSIYDTSVLTQKATARLAAKFSGDFGAVENEIQFVREESERLGIEFKVLLDQYTRFINSVPDGTLSLDQIRYTFVGVAEAGRVAGLSADDFNGVFTALSQIASKGTVALEELRGQIAERIPGAVELMSKGLTDVTGKLVSVSEMMERISKGELSATAVVAFAKALKDEFGPGLELAVNSTVAEMSRFQNTLTDIQSELAKSGFITTLTNGLRELNIELRSSEFKSSMKDLAQGLVLVTSYVVELIKNLDVVLALLKGILLIKVSGYLTNLATAIMTTVAASKTALIGLTAYGSALATLKVTVMALLRGLLLIPAAFYFGYAAGKKFFEMFPAVGRVATKFFLALYSHFDKLGITIGESVDHMTLYFKRGWVNVIRDVAKLMTDFLPAVLAIMLRRVADQVGIFSDAIAEKISSIAEAVANSNDKLVDSLFDKLAPDVDITDQVAALKAAADKARAEIDDNVTQLFADIDRDVSIINPTKGKEDAERFGQEFVDALGEIDYFQVGSNAGASMGDGLLKEFQKIQEALQSETADTLEKRLALIESEFTEFLKKLKDFQISGDDAILKQQENAQKQIQAIRANAGLKEEAKAKAIADIEFRSAQEVARIRSEQAQLGNAGAVVQQLIEVRKEKERQSYYDEQATAAEKKISDLVSKRKEEQSRINEQAELGLITTEQQAAKLEELNTRSLAQIRIAVEEARKLAETTGNATLQNVVAGFDGLEELERRRALVDQLEAQEGRINDELALRETRLSTINTLRETGVIGTAEAEAQSRQLLSDSNLILGEMVDKAIQLANTLGDAGLVAKLEQVKAGLKDVNAQVFSGADLSQNFASGFTSAFRSFVDGTMSAKDAFRSFVADFLAKIAEAILQAVILKAITGSFTGGTGGVGGAIAGGLNSMFNHQGGIVGVDGYRKMVNPMVFAHALQYHSGGIAGLKPDEVPTILQKGEEVLTASDPRHRNNMSSSQQIGVKIVNTIDSGSVISEGLNTASGQKAIINTIRANKSAIKNLLA